MPHRAFEARWSAVARVLSDVGIAGGTVLDVGTLAGAFAKAAADELGATVDAYDVRDRGWPPHPGVSWNVLKLTPGVIRGLPRYDAVLALSVLHHMPRWAPALDALRRRARHVLIVEVPDPNERLTHADVRDQLPALAAAVEAVSFATIGATPATRQPGEFTRLLHVIPPLLTGTMVDGGGHHAANSARFADRFTDELGWTPYPGSLNVAVGHGTDLTTRPDFVVIGDRRRYRMWTARLPAVPDVPVALMACRAKPSGRSVELLAPIRLRDVLDPELPVDVEVLPPVRL